MDIQALFYAKTEEELNEIVERNNGKISHYDETHFHSKIKYEVRRGKYIEVTGKSQPSEVNFWADFPEQSIRIFAYSNGNSIRVMQIEEL